MRMIKSKVDGLFACPSGPTPAQVRLYVDGVFGVTDPLAEQLVERGDAEYADIEVEAELDSKPDDVEKVDEPKKQFKLPFKGVGK